MHSFVRNVLPFDSAKIECVMLTGIMRGYSSTLKNLKQLKRKSCTLGRSVKPSYLYALAVVELLLLLLQIEYRGTGG